MVQELTYYSNVSEIMAEASGTTEASGTELRSLMRQVEVELHHSSTYERVVSNLQTLPTEMGQQLHRMMNAIGREAIRLAFRQWAAASSEAQSDRSSEASSELRSEPSSPSSPSSKVSFAAPPPPPPPSASPVAVAAGHTVHDQTLQDKTRSALKSPAPSASGTRTQSRSARSRRLSKKELAAQAAIQKWEAQLRQLGAEVRRVRQSKAQSPYQLHLKTQVPLHQIEALEAGQLDRLPEDIYIRGFLRRLGDALDLDGTALAASLPQVDPVQAILPTWYHPPTPTGGHLRPIHLYVGYAALLAGGFTWLTSQSVLKEPTSPAPTIVSPTQVQGAQRQSTHLSAPASQRISAISPPERQL